MELTIDCLRLLLSVTARFHKAMEEAVAFTDETHPEFGDVAPPDRPVDEVRAAMAEADPLTFRNAIILAGVAMSWAAMRTDCTVADIFTEFEEQLRRSQRGPSA